MTLTIPVIGAVMVVVSRMETNVTYVGYGLLKIGIDFFLLDLMFLDVRVSRHLS